MNALLDLMQDVPGFLYARAIMEAEFQPDIVIKRAREGCVPSCMALREAIRNMKLPPEAAPAALEVFAANIAKSCPPDKAEMCRFQLAEASFAALSSAFVFLIPNMKDPPFRPILQEWSSILEWAKARFIQDVHKNGRLSTNPQESWFQLAMFLEGTQRMRDEKEFQAAATDHRLLELVIHLFLGPDHFGNIPVKRISISVLLLCIDLTLLRGEGTTTAYRKVLDDVLALVQGRPELLLDPILAMLSRENLTDNPDLTVMQQSLEALGKLAGATQHPFNSSLEESGLAPLSRSLGVLENLAPAKKCTDQFAEVFGLCAALFGLCAASPDGKSWVLQALHKRILTNMAACSSKLSNAPRDRLYAIKSLVLSSIPHSLIDSSVIFTCEGELVALSAEDHKQILSSALGPAWRSFVNRFFEQYVFYCYFEVAGYHRGCYKCATAANGERNTALKKCGGCNSVEYCSQNCQTSHWKEHKKDCKLLKDRKHGPLPSWATPLFRRRLAAYDARRHLPGIRALAAQKYPCLPLQCIHTTINYEVYPPVVTIDLLKGCPINYDKLLEEAWNSVHSDMCFDDARLHDGSTAVLLAVDYEKRHLLTEFQAFLWSPPYFSSKYGTSHPQMQSQNSIVTPYVNKEERPLETTWSVVDEIAYRGKISPQLILDGKLGEIRRRVLEVVVREKARMRVGR